MRVTPSSIKSFEHQKMLVNSEIMAHQRDPENYPMVGTSLKVVGTAKANGGRQYTGLDDLDDGPAARFHIGLRRQMTRDSESVVLLKHVKLCTPEGTTRDAKEISMRIHNYIGRKEQDIRTQRPRSIGRDGRGR